MLESIEKDFFVAVCVANWFKLRSEQNTDDSEGHSTGKHWELLTLSDIKLQECEQAVTY
jgi:hypothetical protein